MQKLIDRIDALSLRERLLLLAAALFVLFSAWNFLLIQPLDKQQAAAQKQIAMLHKQVDALNTAIRTSVEASTRDPNAILRQQITQTRHQISTLDASLREATGGLVDPKDMAPLLEQVLEKQHGLRLVSIHSQPPEPLIKIDHGVKDSAAAVPAVSLIYRHGLTIELEGSYAATLAYLQALEKLRWHFYWDSVELHMDRYPNNRVTIVVHTLSLNEGWLGV